MTRDWPLQHGIWRGIGVACHIATLNRNCSTAILILSQCLLVQIPYVRKFRDIRPGRFFVMVSQVVLRHLYGVISLIGHIPKTVGLKYKNFIYLFRHFT